MGDFLSLSLPVSTSLCMFLCLCQRERGVGAGEASIAGETLESQDQEAHWKKRPLRPTLKRGKTLRSGWVKGHPLSHFPTSAVRLEVTVLLASPEVLDGLCRQSTSITSNTYLEKPTQEEQAQLAVPGGHTEAGAESSAEDAQAETQNQESRSMPSFLTSVLRPAGVGTQRPAGFSQKPALGAGKRTAPRYRNPRPHTSGCLFMEIIQP